MYLDNWMKGTQVKCLTKGKTPPKKLSVKEVHRNVRLLLCCKALIVFDLVFVVTVPFYQQNGLSYSEILIVVSGMFASNLLSEIPGGRFADRYGRKPSIVLGAALTALSSVTLSLSYGFWPILAVALLVGVSMSFTGGADRALVYDSLKSVGQVSAYRRFEARAFAYQAVGGSLAALTSTWLVAYGNLRLLAWAQIPVYMLLLGVTFLLREVRPQEVKPIKPRRSDVWRLIKYLLHDHRKLKWTVLYTACLTTSLDLVSWLRPAYYQFVNIPLGWFGAMQAVALIGMAVAARVAHRWERLGLRKTMWILTGYTTGGLILSAVMPSVGMLFIFISVLCVFGISCPILNSHLNRMIESEVRASSLSVVSLVTRLFFCIVSPFVGWLVDAHSLPTALWFSAAIFGGLGTLTLLLMPKDD